MTTTPRAGLAHHRPGGRRAPHRWPVLALVLAAAAPPSALAQASAPVALQVVSARTEPRAFGGAGVQRGDPVTTYRYVLNVDNAGTAAGSFGDTPACTPSAAGYPASCPWPSVAAVRSSSPIYTQGTDADFAGTMSLPPGRYLVSVLADGYKLDGAHFTVPGDALVRVELQPWPLPTATVRAAVFEDNAPTNGAPDVPAERGLAGFQGQITEILDLVTTDVYGNPLCTEYERDAQGQIIAAAPDYVPTPIAGTGGKCLSRCELGGAVVPPEADGLHCPVGAMGVLEIPNLGPNRYAVSVSPPNGSAWAQTTTLEGNLDWDHWVMEAATGNDTEFVQAGEPFPWAMFGYVRPTGTLPAGASAGKITGVVMAAKVYIPTAGGPVTPGTIWGGTSGARVDRPVASPWLALSDLTAGDTAVWVGQGGADGTFTIENVPPGNYTLTYWDSDLTYILDLVNVTVGAGETVDVGWLPLTGWFTTLEGYVFNDLNRNGKRDPGEPGLANFPVAIKKRENSLMDRGAKIVTTDAAGHYVMDNLYPLTQWLVVEAYSDLYYGTGVTWQADNQPTPTTILGAGVDVSILPIIGLGGTLDWGVHAYDATGRTRGLDPRNGGIVGTVSYDTTRNELDPRFAAVEDWQPGIPDLTVQLWQPVPCTAGAACDPTGRYALAADGSYARGKLLNSYLTETWARPTGCVARDMNGSPLASPATLPTAPDAECLEAPLMGVQFQAGFSSVDGNYGFVGGCFGPGGATGPETCADGSEPTPLPAADYLVEVTVPDDALGRPLYQVTREEDINIFNGDQWAPQIPPPPCAGPLHTVDVAGVGTDGYPAVAGYHLRAGEAGPGVTVAASTPVVNQPFADAGGTPYEGQVRPTCDVKLVRVSNGRSIAPTFNYFTEVPLPGRLVTYMIDDLNFSADPTTTFFGEKKGIPHAPVGIYDYTNRLVYTAETDWNGVFDVLLPSTNRINCPTPSGVCSNVYRLVGNDPGVPGRLNPNYLPQYRTISANFEVFPGLLIPADLAPTQVGATVQLPGATTTQPVRCPLLAGTPELFSVSRPWLDAGAATPIEVRGLGFGATRGTGRVTLDGVAVPVSSWSDTAITFTVPAATAAGAHQLRITGGNGRETVNGLTFHVRGPGYLPTVREVGPGRAYAAIQPALEAAAAAAGDQLVVVYPGTPAVLTNPLGAYYENLVVHAPVKLQGVGPGGFQGATWVPGSVLDGGGFGGDTALADAWRTLVASLTWDGNQAVFEGATVTILARAGTFGAGYPAQIDGFTIRGGQEGGFPNNIDQIGGAPTGLPPNVVTQGGGIFANAWARNLQITNNLITSNGGAYGGGIRLGTPNLPAPGTSNQNQGVRIAHNRIIANGGTNLAGGVGIFAGADGFAVVGNDICGNFSAEYGGGLTVYGYSPGGVIQGNRIYLNQSYDEGGGVMIAGELPANPAALSPGTGPVTISGNLIQSNLANDDGGGLRFLMAGNFTMSVFNNLIVNNVSTHEGGGVALNDTPHVRFFNNTVMKNVTTATAVTSNGLPAPAGLATSLNSAALQATLPPGSPPFSNPLLFNDVFWDNRAGTRAGGGVTGIGQAGDPSPVNRWDLGAADGSGLLSPTSSILQVATGTVPSASNLASDPAVVATYDVGLTFVPWRTNPNFVGAVLVSLDVPPELLGDYHLTPTSPAVGAGASSKNDPTIPVALVMAPVDDVDGDLRVGNVDVGADEVASGIATLDFPVTPYLDLFNQPNGQLSASWAPRGTTFTVSANQALAIAPGQALWTTAFGATQEAFATLSSVIGTLGNGSFQGLVLKSSGAGATLVQLEVLYYPRTGTVQVRHTSGGAVTALPAFQATFAANDVMGARYDPATGLVAVFRNGVPVGAATVPLGWSGRNAAGRIGMTTSAGRNGNSRFDNFGGGTLP